MGISLILGGSEPFPGWFGALMQWKLKSFGSKFAQIGPKKVSQSTRLSESNCYLGNAQIEMTLFSKVLPLLPYVPEMNDFTETLFWSLNPIEC